MLSRNFFVPFALVLLTAVIIAPQDAQAKRKVYGERYYDYSDGVWRIWKGRSRPRYSDKSPIPRRKVRFSEKHAPGTIVVKTSEHRLYYVLGNNRAIRYGIGVGRDGFTWTGRHKLSRKAEWPGWTPPKVMIRREARKGRKLPAYMPGGPNNPLGARALYIGSTIYRIHGTNQPWTIGQSMSSGCIRLANEDITDLYNRAKIGTRIVVSR